jgi:hypothetical protein
VSEKSLISDKSFGFSPNIMCKYIIFIE